MIYSPATLMTSEFSHMITELVCYFKNDSVLQRLIKGYELSLEALGNNKTFLIFPKVSS